MASQTAELDAGTPGIVIPDALRLEVLKCANESRFLDGYALALKAGPLESWVGADAKLVAGRLARHLGGSDLYWKLTMQALRERPTVARFQAQRIYGTVERRGLFAAWLLARKLSQATSESADEQAEALICQGYCSTAFRDFRAAGDFFTEARALSPGNPWIWSESSGMFADMANYESALEYVDHALALQPHFRPAVLRKANYLQSLRRDEEAFHVLEDARQHLQSAGVVNLLISMSSEREDWSRMLALLDETEHLLPLGQTNELAWVHARRTDALLGLGRVPEAVTEARKVESKFYDNLVEQVEKGDVGRRVKIDVPFIQQGHNTCAPATLSAVTSYWNNPIQQDTLIGEICYDGTYDFVERRWAQQAGWMAREFKVTWEVATALLDRGIPFVLTTQEINSGHSQAVIGYDTIRQSILIRDPSHRHYAEYGYKEFEKHYAPVGPRGFLLLPASHAEAANGIVLPEAELYDLVYELNCALDGHDLGRAESVLHALEEAAPGHRLVWLARRAIAHYNQNPLASLEAIDGLLALFPDDDRLLYGRLRLLRTLGRQHEAHELIQKRCREKDVPSLFWREYAQELQQEKNRTGTALRMARRTLQGMPHDVDALTISSGIFWTIQNRPEALAIQRLAVCVGDKNESAADGYFRMQMACGQSAAGIDFLRQRFTDLIGKSSAPAITLINALDCLDRAAEMREVLDEGLARRPDDGDLLLRRANFEASTGHLEESRKFLDLAASHTRLIPWLRAASHLENLFGNYAVSLEHWQKIVELSPLDVNAHRQIAWLLARRDGSAVARDYVRTLGEQFPDHPGILSVELGWRKAEHPEEMEQRVAAFLSRHPTDAWARREYVLMLEARQSFGEALEQAVEARQFEPYSVASWQVESSILEATNRRAEARSHLKQAISLSIDSVYAIRRFVFLADSVEEKREAIAFIDGEFVRQTTSGEAIPVYREVCFPILEITQLTENLRAHWQQRPDLWQSWHTLMHQLIAIGQPEEARDIATGATERFPTLPVVWRDSARLHQRFQAWPEAIECLQQALRINPDWSPAICDMAEIYRHTSKMKEARDLLERAHQRTPLEAPVLGTLADLTWHLGEHETAVGQVKRAVESDPQYGWGWGALSRWSLLLHQKDAALEMARERAQRLGSDADAWLRVASLTQRPELAGERLEAALRARACEPRNGEANDAVASALADQRRFDEGVEACRPAAYGGRIPIFLQGREAWLLAQQNKGVEAIEKMKAVVALDPHYLWGWERLVDWHFNLNHFKDSVAACERVIRLSPMNAVSYGKRARAYVKLTQEKEAEGDFQRAMALDPYYTYAGWQLLKLQMARKAFADAEKTLDLLRPYNSPGFILPSEIVLAGKQDRWDVALERVKKMALLPEVDTGVAQEAFRVLDAGKQTAAVNKMLTSLVSEPALNPFIADLWATRVDLVGKRKLLFFQKDLSWYLGRMAPESRALAAVLENVILGSKKTEYPARLIRRIVKRFPTQTRQHTAVWAVVGQIYATAARWRETADWLKDWEPRPDVEGWMVTNLVFALHSQGRVAEADAVSEKLLARGLRDHTSAYHLTYLGLSALERNETARARELINAVHQESDKDYDKYFFLVVAKSLAVQEAEPGADRRDAAKLAREQISQMGTTVRVTRIRKAAARAARVMARDAGGFGAWAYSLRAKLGTGTVSQRRSSPFTVGVVVVIVVVNLLRACASNH